MTIRLFKLAAALSFPAILGGCVTAAEYSSKNAGFTTVSAKTSEATGKQTVWIQNRAEAQATATRVKSLMSAKTIDVETAVQVALLNNKGLQAAYTDLGESAATAWQSTMLVNPRVGIGLTGIGTPGLRAYKAIEGVIVTNILALATLKQNVEIADTGFRKAQLAAALKTLQLAADTRRAWITAVAAWENVGQLAQAQAAADAASELAKKLGEAGSLNKEGQAREQVFYAELTGQIAKARLEARLAKEELTRLMGLWGGDIEYTIPNRLPQLPKDLAKRDMIEAEALQRLNQWGGQPLPLNASCWVPDAAGADTGTLYLRLRGARAAVEAACRSLGGVRLDDAATAADWQACREQTLPWFAQRAADHVLWRLSVPQTAPVLNLAGEQLVEWGGGQRWLTSALPAAQVREAAARLTVPSRVIASDPKVYSIFKGSLAQEVLANPVVTMSVVAGAGHSQHRDKPEETMRQLLDALT